jgi:hypothetical protein
MMSAKMKINNGNRKRSNQRQLSMAAGEKQHQRWQSEKLKTKRRENVKA